MSNEDSIQPDDVVQGSGLAEEPHGSTQPDAPFDPIAAMLGGGGGGAGGLDFGAIMEQAQEMQARLVAAQEEAADTVVEGVAGGGAVKIQVSGDFDFQSVTISPDAVDPDDVEMLQDLVLAAVRDAIERVQKLQEGSMGLGGMDLGGMDLGGLLGGN